MNESITINVYLDNLSEEDREKFLTLVEKAKEPRSKVWKPMKNKTWYYITGYGYIEETVWHNNDFCEQSYALGNCFKTKEEAKFTIEKLKVIAELKRFAEEHNDPINWTDLSQSKYYIQYDYSYNAIELMDCVRLQCVGVVFSSYELAEQAVETIGEERLKKYYFGIKEEIE